MEMTYLSDDTEPALKEKLQEKATYDYSNDGGEGDVINPLITPDMSDSVASNYAQLFKGNNSIK